MPTDIAIQRNIRNRKIGRNELLNDFDRYGVRGAQNISETPYSNSQVFNVQPGEIWWGSAPFVDKHLEEDALQLAPVDQAWIEEVVDMGNEIAPPYAPLKFPEAADWVDEEAPVEEAPVEEAPVEEAPVEEAPVEKKAKKAK
jgi:hypothetical protein